MVTRLNREFAPTTKTKARYSEDDFEICPRCNRICAYAYPVIDFLVKHGFEIFHIPVASGLGEWQCGNCETYWVERNSPINHPAYTHRDDGSLHRQQQK